MGFNGNITTWEFHGMWDGMMGLKFGTCGFYKASCWNIKPLNKQSCLLSLQTACCVLQPASLAAVWHENAEVGTAASQNLLQGHIENASISMVLVQIRERNKQ